MWQWGKGDVHTSCWKEVQDFAIVICACVWIRCPVLTHTVRVLFFCVCALLSQCFYCYNREAVEGKTASATVCSIVAAWIYTHTQTHMHTNSIILFEPNWHFVWRDGKHERRNYTYTVDAYTHTFVYEQKIQPQWMELPQGLILRDTHHTHTHHEGVAVEV